MYEDVTVESFPSGRYDYRPDTPRPILSQPLSNAEANPAGYDLVVFSDFRSRRARSYCHWRCDTVIGAPVLMLRKVVGFDQDDDGEWLAELECGHSRHVRHTPPWVNRPWVITPEGRRRFIGQELNCNKCITDE